MTSKTKVALPVLGCTKFVSVVYIILGVSVALLCVPTIIVGLSFRALIISSVIVSYL